MGQGKRANPPRVGWWRLIAGEQQVEPRLLGRVQQRAVLQVSAIPIHPLAPLHVLAKTGRAGPVCWRRTGSSRNRRGAAQGNSGRRQGHDAPALDQPTHFCPGVSAGITVRSAVSWPSARIVTDLPLSSSGLMKSGSSHAPDSTSSQANSLYSPGGTLLKWNWPSWPTVASR